MSKSGLLMVAAVITSAFFSSSAFAFKKTLYERIMTCKPTDATSAGSIAEIVVFAKDGQLKTTGAGLVVLRTRNEFIASLAVEVAFPVRIEVRNGTARLNFSDDERHPEYVSFNVAKLFSTFDPSVAPLKVRIPGPDVRESHLYLCEMPMKMPMSPVDIAGEELDARDSKAVSAHGVTPVPAHISPARQRPID